VVYTKEQRAKYLLVREKLDILHPFVLDNDWDTAKRMSVVKYMLKVFTGTASFLLQFMEEEEIKRLASEAAKRYNVWCYSHKKRGRPSVATQRRIERGKKRKTR
jgi:hypothetical protein